jgi:glycerol-3-phosphate dehydrogenase (NAD(P)+)
MTISPIHIGIISAGAWGTALAVIANRAGSRVTLYSNNAHVRESITAKRTNDTYLPGIFLDPHIGVTDDVVKVCSCDFLILAIPSHHMRSTCIWLSDQIEAKVPLVIATKGIERGSLALMSEVVSTILPRNPVAILSGPNFAVEAARGLPTATTIACQDEQLASQIIYGLGGKYFRPYHTDDIMGTQIGGAVKNVIAIASGIALGRGFGENARAAIITRGIAEMARLCLFKGGRQETLMGLSGIGDLMLTCTSETSRNMSLGLELGQLRQPVKVILENRQKRLAEGVTTADSVTELARKIGISMPICMAVRDILYNESQIDDVIQHLLERPFVTEILQTSF